MSDEERIARSLGKRLLARCADAEVAVEGRGVHWKVDVRRGARSCAVSCFWYEAALHALMLGMNTANARSSMQPAITPHQGAEYLVRFRDGDEEVADGRARDDDDALASIAAWMAGETLGEIERRWPYVDEEPRRYRAVMAMIEPHCRDVARCVLEKTPVDELWVYGDGRSCRVHLTAEGHAVSFRLGPVQVAFASATDDVAGLIERWMRGATLLAIEAAGAQLERHAQLLEAGEVARWHWARTRERIEDDDDVLAASRPLLRRLAQSEIATEFFSYSSLYSFCFSASSHFPWVNEALPVIFPPLSDRGYAVEIGQARTECTIDEAVALVEKTLRAYPVRPFFGSATDLLLERVDAELERQRSPLRASLVQVRQWYRVELRAGARRCEIDDDPWKVTYLEPSARDETFETLAAAVTASVAWLSA